MKNYIRKTPKGPIYKMRAGGNKAFPWAIMKHFVFEKRISRVSYRGWNMTLRSPTMHRSEHKELESNKGKPYPPKKITSAPPKWQWNQLECAYLTSFWFCIWCLVRNDRTVWNGRVSFCGTEYTILASLVLSCGSFLVVIFGWCKWY